MSEWHHPVLSCRQSIAFEKDYFRGDASLAAKAMESAGRALGQAVWEESGKRIACHPTILVILGKGHNAGDALIACHELMTLNPAFEVDLLPLFGVDVMAPAVWPWYERVRGNPGVRTLDVDALETSVRKRYGLSLDGVFGMQFRPPLKGDLAERFGSLNRLAIDLRVAVDLPSGISDESDDGALRADFTYATGIFKAPLCNPANLSACGRVRYLDLDFFNKESLPDCSERVLSPQLLKRATAMRPILSDKRSNGHLLIVAGSRSMPGALLMAVKSALSSGVGLVTVVAPESVAMQCCTQGPEAMWLPWSETPNGGLALDGLLDLQGMANKVTAVMMGPGVGREKESQALLDGVCELFSISFILDADALQKDRIQLLKRLNRTAVLTPHEGEFRRIAGIPEGVEITPERVRDFSRETGVTVVLKGPLTRIVTGESTYFSPYGGPVLARGGSGDLLAGLIAGKIANPAIPDLSESVSMGVALHGKAADSLASGKGETHVHTTQILDYLHPF